MNDAHMHNIIWQNFYLYSQQMIKQIGHENYTEIGKCFIFDQSTFSNFNFI